MTTQKPPQTSLARPQGGDARDLAAVLKTKLPTLSALAGQYLNADRLLSLALVATRKTPQLLQCSQESVVQAVMDAAKLGLEPDGVEGAIIPYGREAQFQPMVQGLVHVVLDEGSIVGVDMRAVHEGDEFDVQMGSRPSLHHKPNMRRDLDAPVIAYYSVAHTATGFSTFEVMTYAEVVDHRKRYAKSRGGPWETAFDEMAKKTVFKRHSKKLPKGRRLRDAISHDNDVESMVILSDDANTATARQEKISKALNGRNAPKEEQQPADDVPPEPEDFAHEEKQPEPEQPKKAAPQGKPADVLATYLVGLPATGGQDALRGYLAKAFLTVDEKGRKMLTLLGKKRLGLLGDLMTGEAELLAEAEKRVAEAGGFADT